MMAVCVDVGKTTTRVGVYDEDWIVIERSPTSDIATGTKTEFLTGLEKQIRTSVSSQGIDEESIDRIAVAAPGPIDTVSETAYFLHDEPIGIETLSSLAPTYLMNDATCGAVAEHRLGNHDTDDILYVTISTSIGAGVVLGGEIVQGWRGNAGEVGHLKLTDCEIPCPWCDGIGHWMAACSGSQLPALAKSVADKDISEASELFAAATSGKTDALAVLDRMHAHNAEALTQLINILNPEVVVLDGGVVLNNEQEVLEGINQHFATGCFNSYPHIEIANLGDRSVLEGLRIICTQSTGMTPIHS